MLLLFQFWYAAILVGAVLSQEGMKRDASQHFLNFRSIRQNRHEKTLTHIRESKKIAEKITKLCLQIRIITLRSSSGKNFEPL